MKLDLLPCLARDRKSPPQRRIVAIIFPKEVDLHWWKVCSTNGVFIIRSKKIYSTGLLIFRGKKSKISRDFQGQIRGKIGRFRGKKVKIHGTIGRFRGRKVKLRRKIGRFRGILAEKSQFSKDFQGQILRKIGRFMGNLGGKVRQETISKKQPISLDLFGQISLKSINFASI